MHFERRKEDMDFASEMVDAVKTAVGPGVTAGDVVAVIGKLFSWREPRCLSHDFVALDHEPGAVRVLHDPFSSQESDAVFGAVVNGDVIDEGVRLVRWQAGTAMMVGEFVESGGETGKRVRTKRHAAKRTETRRVASVSSINTARPSFGLAAE